MPFEVTCEGNKYYSGKHHTWCVHAFLSIDLFSPDMTTQPSINSTSKHTMPSVLITPGFGREVLLPTWSFLPEGLARKCSLPVPVHHGIGYYLAEQNYTHDWNITFPRTTFVVHPQTARNSSSGGSNGVAETRIGLLGSHFLHLHAVFEEYCLKLIFIVPIREGVESPPLGNPGSTTVKVQPLLHETQLT